MMWKSLRNSFRNSAVFWLDFPYGEGHNKTFGNSLCNYAGMCVVTAHLFSSTRLPGQLSKLADDGADALLLGRPLSRAHAVLHGVAGYSRLASLSARPG